MRRAVFLSHLNLYRFSVYVIIFFVRDNRQVAWNCRNGETWNGQPAERKKTALRQDQDHRTGGIGGSI